MSIGSAAAAITIGTALGTAGAGIYGANKSSQAAQQGAQLTSQAANYAADKQAQAAAASLAFEKQKDAEALAQFNATQKANYDQWAAREARMNDIRAQLGMPAHDIPAYVPTTTLPGSTPPTPAPAANAAGGPIITTTSGQVIQPSATPMPSATPTPSATPAPPSGNPTDRNFIMQQLQGVYSKLGVTPTGRGTGPTDIAYMADQIANTGGWTPQNAGYWPTRIAQELGKASAAPAPANTLGAFLSSSSSPSAGLAPPSATPQLPYMTPGTIYAPTIASWLPQQQP